MCDIASSTTDHAKIRLGLLCGETAYCEATDHAVTGRMSWAFTAASDTGRFWVTEE